MKPEGTLCSAAASSKPLFKQQKRWAPKTAQSHKGFYCFRGHEQFRNAKGFDYQNGSVTKGIFLDFEDPHRRGVGDPPHPLSDYGTV